MKAESEVSIPFARSIFLDKEFTPDDDTLNYESYKKLGLTCGKCRQSIFFKRCKERVSHFSHFNETGKGCEWKTKNNTNTSKQDTDSESREQSLEKFQIKFHRILDRGIITYQNISKIQLKNCKVQGKTLVAQYRIDIESWLNEFNKEREKETEPIREIALSIYKNNNELSEIQCRVLANLVDYLCVPPSKYILEDTLYYVFYLLNKNVSVNNDYQEVCSKVIEIISFADWEEKEYKRPKELVERQRPKPIKLDGAKVAQGTVIFRSVVGTTPLLACLVPSGKQWKLIGLPVKVPEYDLARYVVGNLSQNQAIAYLHREIDRLKNQNKVNSLKLIAKLENLLIEVVKGEKLNSDSLRESTVVIRKYLDKAEFKHNSLYTDNYYRSHTLGDVSFIQELESKKLTYTFIWGSEKATRQSEVPSVIKWLKRVPTSLGKQFPITFPSFEEIRDYVRSIFKFENVELIIKEERGIYIEIYYEGRLQARQLLDITSQISKDTRASKVSTKVSTSIQYVGDSEFYSLLRCTSADRQLVREAKSQLEKIVQEFLAANPARFRGENKVSMPTSVADICGFGSTAKSINQVIETFKKFSRPFTSESEVGKGQLINFQTLQTYDQHNVAQLLELMTKNWKHWPKSKDEKIKLGGQLFHKPDPGKLMLVVHNLLDEQPHLDTLVWRDLIDVFYQLSRLSIGFRCENGVVLTPHHFYESGVERWSHRIKVQLIDLLLKDQSAKQLQADKILKDAEDLKDKLAIESAINLVRKTKQGSIEGWLQMSIATLYAALEKVDSKWESKVSADVLKHLSALHEALSISEQIEAS
ncbi:hypothetical protein QUB63_06210 [Microcoleus sp. ARI1-B5]|uniref:hypothetical protein n=1 Tax=unclassified Microcoleus TaxID=2642155 RepID=UPI002FCEAA1C